MGSTKDAKYTVKVTMEKLQRGEFNIPRFQREFVWKATKIISLLKSIESNYPIGNLTTAIIEDNPFKGRNQIIDAISTEYEKNAMIVVDGQQRLTSLAIVWFAAELDKKIALGMLRETKIRKTILSAINKLCLYEGKFYVVTDLIEQIAELDQLTETKAKIKANNFLISNKGINEEVRKKIGGYEIFNHTLVNWNLSEIINIFQAMNQKTKPLTHIDLMNGSLFSISDENFDLYNFIKMSNVMWEDRRGKIKPELFVILMKLFSDIKIMDRETTEYKSDALISWANEKKLVDIFLERKHEFTDKIKDTFAILDNKLNIYEVKKIPKDVYFINIFAIVCLGYKGNEMDKVLSNVISYTSKRLVYGMYASSPNARAMEDINQYILKMHRKQSTVNVISKLDDWEERFELEMKNINYRNKNQAIFKLAIAALASTHPKNLFDLNDVPVNPTELRSSVVDIHHFIPSKSDFENDYNFGERLNSIGNLALLSGAENKKISNKNPEIYLTEAEEKNKKFRTAIDSHLFDYDILMKIKDHKNLNSVQINELIDSLFNDREETIFDLMKDKYFADETDI